MSIYRRSLLIRLFAVVPWAFCLLVVIASGGWVPFLLAGRPQPLADDEGSWIWAVLLFVVPPAIALFSVFAFTLAHLLSPLQGHRIPTGFWTFRQRRGDLAPFGLHTLANYLVLGATCFRSRFSSGQVDLAIVGQVVFAASLVLVVAHVAIAIEIYFRGLAELRRKSAAESANEVQRGAEERSRQEQLRQQQTIEGERQRTERTIRFEEMRRQLTQAYLQNMEFLGRTHWSSDYIRAFFNQAEACYQQRWSEVQTAFHAYEYDLHMHAEVWKVACAYEQVAHVIGERLSKDHLWELLRGIQQTQGRKKSPEKIAHECRELAEMLRQLCEQSHLTFLTRHDDELAGRYEELLSLERPAGNYNGTSPTRSSPSNSHFDVVPGSGLMPPLLVTSDA